MRARLLRICVIVAARLLAASLAAMLGWVFWSVFAPVAAGWLPMLAVTAIVAATPLVYAIFGDWRRPGAGVGDGKNG
jgi:hypothetical protein